MLQQLVRRPIATFVWIDIFSLPYRFMTLFMINDYFHLKKKKGYFLFAPQVTLTYMQLTTYVLLDFAFNRRHHDAPDSVNQFCAIADSDFIPNLIASLHLQVTRHLTIAKLMIEK